MLTMTTTSNASAIWNIYEERGGDAYDGEAVTQLEHAVQGAEIALEETGDIELAVAALLHDIGHLLPHDEHMNGFGIMHHEALGANFLREHGFSDNVVRLVGAHVAAKRFLTFAEPGYYEQLSVASKETLIFQGGIMTIEEADRFQRDPLFEKFLLLRRIDERAKTVGMPPPDIGFWKKLVETHLEAQVQERRKIW